MYVCVCECVGYAVERANMPDQLLVRWFRRDDDDDDVCAATGVRF